jgi:hypothetical protein
MFVLFSRDQSFYILCVGCVGVSTTCGLNILFARPGNFMLHPDKVDLPDNLIFQYQKILMHYDFPLENLLK